MIAYLCIASFLTITIITLYILVHYLKDNKSFPAASTCFVYCLTHHPHIDIRGKTN